MNKLSPVAFHILLALSVRPCHGYGLLQQIRQDSNGAFTPGTGLLYGTLKQLSAANIIEEMPFEGDSRRRYYRLTKKGWDLLSSEAMYLQRLAGLISDRL